MHLTSPFATLWSIRYGAIAVCGLLATNCADDSGIILDTPMTDAGNSMGPDQGFADSTSRAASDSSSTAADDASVATMTDQTLPDASLSSGPGSDAADSGACDPSTGKCTPSSDVASTSGAMSDAGVASSSSAPASSSDQPEETSGPPPVIVDPNNLIEHPSFEPGTPSFLWTAAGGAVISMTTQAAHTGSRSLRCAGRVQGWEGPSIDVVSLVEPGQQYVVSGWVRSTDETGQPFHILRQATCEGDGGAATDPSYVQLAATYTDDTWAQIVSEPFTVPDCSLTSFVIYFEGPAPGKVFDLDDVSLTVAP